MDKQSANELAQFIKEHSRGLQVGTVKVCASVRGSARYWVVRAMVSTQEEGGTRWWLEYFRDPEQFKDTEWYDAHAPLRIAVLVAESMVSSQGKYLAKQVGDITQALRDLADRIDRDFASMDSDPNVTPERTAQSIQSAILWAVPNLGIENLYPNAAMLTQHRAKASATHDALLAAELAVSLMQKGGSK